MVLEAALVLVTGILGYFQGDLATKIFSSTVWGLAALGLLTFIVFAYHYVLAPVRLLSHFEQEISKHRKTDTTGLQILFRRDEAPFDTSFRGWKQLCIGVKNSDPHNTADDVSVRLERIEPNDCSVPLLEFREMVSPFPKELRSRAVVNTARSVNLNPLQTRYFEIAFTHGGAHCYELCFFPTNYPLKTKSYLLGIRVTGRDFHSEYAEFQLVTTETGEWYLERKAS
jgi:hypothetical protein